jgi:hypothetical protein
LLSSAFVEYLVEHRSQRVTQNALQPPTRGARHFNCPRCGALAQQGFLELFVDADGRWQAARDEPRRVTIAPTSDTRATWAMSFCFACKNGSVWRGTQLIYPAVNTLPLAHKDMPEATAALYEEARAVGAVSRRAGAAFGRAALEKLIRELRPDVKGNLDERVAALQPEVSTALWQMLTVLRHTGNKALHGADASDVLVAFILEDDDGSTLGLLLGAINDLVEELKTRPAQAAALFSQLPPDVANLALRKAGLPEVHLPPGEDDDSSADEEPQVPPQRPHAPRLPR